MKLTKRTLLRLCLRGIALIEGWQGRTDFLGDFSRAFMRAYVRELLR